MMKGEFTIGKIKVGANGFFRESSRVTALCEVVEIIGLSTDGNLVFGNPVVMILLNICM
jgi:hypothetical protein